MTIHKLHGEQETLSPHVPSQAGTPQWDVAPYLAESNGS